jgi:hypothetical protein
MLPSRITEQYVTHDLSRLCQGDLFQSLVLGVAVEGNSGFGVQELTFPYVVLISQDCDLQQEHDARKKWEEALATGIYKPDDPPLFPAFQPNVLLLPAFLEELVRSGEHLKPIYGIKTSTVNSTLWGKIKINGDERYHVLAADSDRNLPLLVIDFKTYLSVPKESFAPRARKTYRATLNELFREDLTQRFAHYMSRIALPELTAPHTVAVPTPP